MGEFLVILGAVTWEPWVGYVAAFTIIFAAVYLLYMVQNIIMGDVTDFLKGLGDKLTGVDRTDADGKSVGGGERVVVAVRRGG